MRVLVVEDHPATRLGLKTVLEAEEGIEVVGEAQDARGALDLIARLRPDLVILDLRLRGESGGVKLCREIKSWPCPPRILVYTAHSSPQAISSCRLSGADSYVHKSEDATKLLEAVENVHAGKGEWLFGMEIEDTKTRTQNAEERTDLTDKEQEVFVLLLKRRTNPEIAEELYISRLTAKTHVANILRKLGLKSRREIS